MNFTVTGITVETEGMTPEQLEQSKIFSGKNAGICYMGDSYFDSSVSDPAKALPRFESTIKMAHHSIADHVRIEVLMEGVSKMMAIILNSLQDYATSEKSGRYTIMTGNSEKECELYEKWCKIYQDVILKEEETIDDEWLRNMFEKKYPDSGYIIACGRCTEVEPKLPAKEDWEAVNYFRELLNNNNRPSRKKAQENARYVLSVFTRSTTMGYSTSLRQWNYIYDWCQKYLSQFMPRLDESYANALAGENDAVTIVYKGTDKPVTYFERELYFDMLKLSNFIYDTMYIENLRDTKNRHFQFLVGLSGEENHEMLGYDLSSFEPDGYTGKYECNDESWSRHDILDTMYMVSYPASFVHIAQTERHRTLKYFMYFNPHCKNFNFFIPPIIRGTGYEVEWLLDLSSVKEFYPQAIMPCIVETGFIGDFVLKCQERLCSKAQWEIMHQTMLTAKRFISAMKSHNCSPMFYNYVHQLESDITEVTTKCQLQGHCAEGCKGGCKYALTRKF